MNFVSGNCKSYSCAYFTNHLNLENNQLPTVHPAAFFGANWTDVPNFQMDDYYGPGLTIYLESNPLICSTICWMHHAEASLGPVDCADGIDWDNWDGFDSNGQCLIPPKPVCPVPSSIPVLQDQCPTRCSGKLHLAIFLWTLLFGFSEQRTLKTTNRTCSYTKTSLRFHLDTCLSWHPQITQSIDLCMCYSHSCN